MRLSKGKVVQLIEKENPQLNTIVIVDQSTGEEIELNREEVNNLSTALAYFSVALDEDDAPECTCITTNPHAVNCAYRHWKANQ